MNLKLKAMAEQSLEQHIVQWTQANAKIRRFEVRSHGRAKAQAVGADLELVIFDVIGLEWRDGSITAKQVERALREHPNAKSLRVLLNSPGGILSEGVAIYNLLKRHAAKVEVEVMGEAFSAASVIMMAGDRIVMAPGSMCMVHPAWSCMCGGSADMRAAADYLDSATDSAVDIYARRTGKTEGEVRALVEANNQLGTYMTAAQTVEMGFADALADEPSDPAVDTEPSDPMPQPEARAQMVAMAMQMTPAPAGQEVPTGERNDTMKEEVFLATIGAKSLDEAHAKFTSQSALLSSLEKATGKTGDEALGVALAWQGDAKKLPEAQAKIAELEKAQAAGELDKAIAQAKADKKLTPAEEKTYREQVDSGAMSVTTVKAILATKAPIPALANAKEEQGGASPNTETDGSLKYQGKSWSELKPAQRAQLKKEDPETYAAMRKDAGLD